MTEEDLQALRDRQLTEANFQRLLARVEALEQQIAQMRDLLEDHKISIKAVSYGMSPLGFGAFKPKE